MAEGGGRGRLDRSVPACLARFLMGLFFGLVADAALVGFCYHFWWRTGRWGRFPPPIWGVLIALPVLWGILTVFVGDKMSDIVRDLLRLVFFGWRR